ncbi:hypothetical protein MLD38_013390 [Melastoma candidum]|uniref:Uncharacterized protein n=1 Tax=Melastoma candidum TaxID=119954 RepID=A0ACB9RHW4_9MYRT|nr:hypothetical protein MLD38_013390 [Melastoma candidum]
MSNSNGLQGTRDWTFATGKQVFLPPKSPFPGNYSTSYSDFVPSMLAGSTVVQRPAPGEGSFHPIQRTSSESCLTDDQPPSWLDDLLNEPETPVRRGGHRRSSSDPFANFNVASGFSQDNNMTMMSAPSWGVFQEFQPYGSLWYPNPSTESNCVMQKNKSMESSSNAPVHRPNRSIPEDNLHVQSNGPSRDTSLEGDGSSTSCERQKHVEHAANASKAVSDRKDSAYGKASSSEADNKRAKQQFAQRSRVRKLQYIAELERNVQALQAKGSEISAEIDFLNQQHMILNMENKSLRQRLENLSQEQLIKTFEHDLLEREVGRLRGLYKQLLQETPSGHKRSSSKDLNLEFSNLSLKH